MALTKFPLKKIKFLSTSYSIMKTSFQKFFLSTLNYFPSSLLPTIFKTHRWVCMTWALPIWPSHFPTQAQSSPLLSFRCVKNCSVFQSLPIRSSESELRFLWRSVLYPLLLPSTGWLHTLTLLYAQLLARKVPDCISAVRWHRAHWREAVDGWDYIYSITTDSAEQFLTHSWCWMNEWVIPLAMNSVSDTL